MTPWITKPVPFNIGQGAAGEAAAGGCDTFPDSLLTSAEGTVDGATIAASGKYDNCLSFDGVSNFVSIDGVAGSSAFSTNEGAISFWVKVNSPTVTDRIHFCFGDTDAKTYLKVNNDSELIQFSLRDTSELVMWEGRKAGGLPNNTWTNIIINKGSGVDVEVYVNNDNNVFWDVEVDRAAWVTSEMNNFRLGCRNYDDSGNSQFFEGFLDDFLITDTALTSDQRTFLQSNPASSLALCDGIKAYYSCNEFDGSGDLPNNATPAS